MGDQVKEWVGWVGGLGCGSDLCVLHSATEVVFADEDWQPGDAFEWGEWWVMCVSVE